MIWKMIIIAIISICLAHLIFISGRNMIILMLILEALFLAVSLLFQTLHCGNEGLIFTNDGAFYAIALIVWSAAETAIVLALISRIHRKTRNITIKSPFEKEENK